MEVREEGNLSTQRKKLLEQMSFLMLRGKIEYSEEIARKAELMLKYDELIKGGNLRKTKIKNTLAKRG